MAKRILILSFPDDYHAQAIAAMLGKQGHEADVVDTSTFPVSSSLTYRAGRESDAWLDGRALSDYHSVWWRRVRTPAVAPEVKIPEERRFAASESREALWGAIQASGLPIYNSPAAEYVADRKPYQLRMAQAAGLRVPDTLITTSQEEVREFRRLHGEIIYKSFGPNDLAVMDTRPLTDADEADLWRLRLAPAIFQEYVPRGREYRVTLVEDDVFAAEIEISRPDAAYDWRNDLAYQAKPAKLPEEVEDGLRRLRRRLGLSSGSADLRETPDGTIYFLEMNPSGQFLFLDIRAGLDIGPRFCEMLLQ
ncbi:MAG TPA: hypothetical protein VF263_13695 [Longimicrobiaceae bacterium]